MTKFRKLLLVGWAVIPLAACGADDIASPGEGVLVPPPAGPAPAPPPPSPPPPGTGGPAQNCPANTTDRGVIGNRRACEISGTITGQRLLQNLAGVVYSLAGRVQVGTDCGA